VQWTREEVLRRLAALKAADPNLRRLGADKHEYKLGAVLSESEVVAVEQRLRVRLPEQYRQFVLRIGDGGAGPDYGINRLGVVEAELCTGIGKQRKLLYDPGRPFARPCDVNEAARLGGYPTFGVLPLVESGCGGAYLLVSAGTERGHVWSFGNDELYLPVYPDSPSYPDEATVQERLQINATFADAILGPANKVRLKFNDWYDRWLQASLR
jgi:hypothetical protein